MIKKTTYGPKKETAEGVAEQKYHRYGKKGIEERTIYNMATRAGKEGSIGMFRRMAEAPTGREKVREVYEDAKKWMREQKLPDRWCELIKYEFGKLDDEYLTRDIIRYAEIILKEGVNIDEVVDAAMKFAMVLKDYNELQNMIFDAKKGRKGSLEPYINNALDALGDDALNKDIYKWLRREGIARRHGDNIICRDSRNISIKTIRGMISRIKKARKKA